MTRVLVTFAGGSYGLGVTRSLKAAAQPHYVIAADANIYSLQRAEGDERHLLPKASDPRYIPALQNLIRKTRAEMLWPGHDSEIELVARERAQFSDVAMFLPPIEEIDLCNDKWESYRAFLNAGVNVPETVLVEQPVDLDDMFGRGYEDGVWLRSTRGAGGKGGAWFASADKAKAWVELHDGWGSFTAAQRIAGGAIFSWSTVWSEGELIVAQRKSPLGQGFAGVTRSGVTGVPGIVRWGGPPEAEVLGEAAIRAVSSSPHGNYGVDMISDRQGRLYVTEINIGRFFNDGLIHWPDEKLNAGDLVVQLALGNPPPFDVPLKNPKKSGNVIIYGLPKMPIEVTEEELRSVQPDWE